MVFSQFSVNLEKSCVLNPAWMTPSAAAAPLFRLSISSMIHCERGHRRKLLTPPSLIVRDSPPPDSTTTVRCGGLPTE